MSTQFSKGQKENTAGKEGPLHTAFQDNWMHAQSNECELLLHNIYQNQHRMYKTLKRRLKSTKFLKERPEGKLLQIDLGNNVLALLQSPGYHSMKLKLKNSNSKVVELTL